MATGSIKNEPAAYLDLYVIRVIETLVSVKEQVSLLVVRNVIKWDLNLNSTQCRATEDLWKILETTRRTICEMTQAQLSCIIPSLIKYQANLEAIDWKQKLCFKKKLTNTCGFDGATITRALFDFGLIRKHFCRN